MINILPQFRSVPGTHKPNKSPLSVQIDRELEIRLKKAARMQGIPVSDLVKEILTVRFGHIRLSAADHDAIDQATRQAKREGRRVATPFYPDAR